MSLLKETHSQNAEFTKNLSCPEINIGNGLNANSVVTNAFQLVTAPTAGFVLTSDADGNGTWGVGALPAYGYAAGRDGGVTAANTLIDFNLGAAAFPNLGYVSVPAVDGTVFVIASAGRYEFNFQVVASNGGGLATILQVGLDVNGVLPGTAYAFRSGLATGDTAEMVCVGSGIVLLAVDDSVGIKNISAVGFDFAAVNNTMNRTLTLKRIA